MVCLRDEGPIPTMVTDEIGTSNTKNGYVQLTPSKNVAQVFSEVAHSFQYSQDDIELILKNRTGKMFALSEHKDKTLEQVGVICSQSEANTITINPAVSVTAPASDSKSMVLCVQAEPNEDDLLLGASASPTTGETAAGGGCGDPPPPLLVGEEEEEDYPVYSFRTQSVSWIDTVNYVGLVNQAMTCYLNSLLQALYMTPEFRNALYNWEFDGQNEARSIPFQLQKLFLNLQTSSKSAVETTDLTTSFGWQGSDAWQQHDIQELCRVMFDALEHKFKDTRQSNLIDDLYEGKMLDYVKCLECGTEKSREDTFLDIPLPVRPFGSQVAYNSVEEALRAFVQPETLDGSNQYHCEKCRKKCDAHKGLKFTKFPYLLTLHLKRFDFDYNTLHRIKLNDKVVFPEKLNLNSFIRSHKSENEQVGEEKEHNNMVRSDDCSTTDSGSALDDEGCQSVDLMSTINGQDINCGDSDEGIDVSCGNSNDNEAKGPYFYDLFSIMIHSGSATGGHYYAYIKDFDKQQWFCFNDQSVTRITDEDIKKTFGGGQQRSYYSGAYSSSTNAYMLMYRQIDKRRNCQAIAVDDFPPHIERLLAQMRQKEERDRLQREKENDLVKINVFCRHPNAGGATGGVIYESPVSVLVDSTLEEAAETAYTNPRFKLGSARVDRDDCRIVKYNKIVDCIDASYDDCTIKFCDISTHINMVQSDWMLEVRTPGTEWKVYKPGGVNMKVFLVNYELEELQEPSLVRVNVNETLRELKLRLVPIVNIEIDAMKVALLNKLQCFESDDEIVELPVRYEDYKLYVWNEDEENDRATIKDRLQKIVDKFIYVVTLNVSLPDTDAGTLELLSIPSLDSTQHNSDKSELAASGDRVSSPHSRISSQLGTGICSDGVGDQSNSEDSSLSDSDRTLVGDAPGEAMGLSSNSSNSPADQHMASPSDPTAASAEDLCERYDFSRTVNAASEEMNWDDDDNEDEKDGAKPCTNNNNNNNDNWFYFKVASVVQYGETSFSTARGGGGGGGGETNELGTEATYTKYCRVMVDNRIGLDGFKKHMEPYVGVPVEYFKIYRKLYPCGAEELSDGILRGTKDDEKFVVKLGRVLRRDECSFKIHLLRTVRVQENVGDDPFTFLFEHVVRNGQTVGQILKEVVQQAKKQHDIDLNVNKCRLREKSYKKPRTIFLHNQIFDKNLFNYSEMFLQELGEPEKVTSSDQLVLFVRRWHPASLSLGPLDEVVLNDGTLDELKRSLAELSRIPVDEVEVAAVGKTAFPFDMHVLQVHEELEWKITGNDLTSWPVQASTGSVFFYRDSTETLKELSAEERKELHFQENKRLGKINSIKTYSPGKERALKIYLDISPCKTNDNYTD